MTLTPSDGPASSTAYEYDESGNIALNSAIGQYTYGTTQPHAAKTAGANRYTYDANGNLATSPHYKYTFDPLNRLIDVRQTDGNLLRRTHLQMTYAASGERVITTDGSKWTLNLGYAYRCDSRNCVRILYGAHGRIGAFSATTSEYLAGDHLGSTMAVLDARGAATSRPDYQAWGAPSPAGAATSTSAPYLFNGKELDRSGLYYFGARYFDPVLGRFISPDPLLGSITDPQSLNPYTYALNNPVTFTDTVGLKVMADGDNPGPNREPAGRNGHDPEKPHIDELPGPSEPRSQPERQPDPPGPPDPNPSRNAPESPRTSSSGPIHESGGREHGPEGQADKREVSFFGVLSGSAQVVGFPPVGGELVGVGGYNSGKGAFVGGIVAGGPELDAGLIAVGRFKGIEGVKYLSGPTESETLTLDEASTKVKSVRIGGGRYSTPKSAGSYVFAGRHLGDLDFSVVKFEFDVSGGFGFSDQAFESIMGMLGITSGPAPSGQGPPCCDIPWVQGPGQSRL